jgi:hypothetical protein
MALGGIQNFNKKQINFLSSYSNGPAQPFMAVAEMPGSIQSGTNEDSNDQHMRTKTVGGFRQRLKPQMPHSTRNANDEIKGITSKS